MGKSASFFILHHLTLNGSEAFCPVCTVLEIFMAPLCVHRHTYPNNIVFCQACLNHVCKLHDVI